MRVKKMKSGTFNVNGLLSEDSDIYTGKDNPIVMLRVYDIEFLFDF